MPDPALPDPTSPPPRSSDLALPDSPAPTAAVPSSRRRFPATASVRLKEVEAERLREAAEALDISVSALLRRATLQYLSSSS